ncbi:hypothetical protein J6590_076906 [Homalodisca vitripennis]|nr:hypothetical protein J6590_076906 [Homalodisca vitripennis]
MRFCYRVDCKAVEPNTLEDTVVKQFDEEAASTMNHVLTGVKLSRGRCSASFSVLLYAVYLLPDTTYPKYTEYYDLFYSVVSGNNDFSFLYVAGDFNLPGIDWSEQLLDSLSPSAYKIKERSSFLELRQYNETPSYYGNFLDLIFSNIDCLVSDSFDSFYVEGKAHPAFKATVEHPKTSRIVGNIAFIPNFRKCNIADKTGCVWKFDHLAITGINVSLTGYPDLAFSQFCDDLRRVILNNTPSERVSVSKFPTCFSIELKDMIILKKTLHRIYKSSMSPADYCRFSHTRAQCKRMAIKCFHRYVGYV